MSVEIGAIVEGKITGLTKFGAFVLLENGETGMVHISEVSTSYVENIVDHLKENQEVKVKVIAINDNGKIGLSIKQALPESERAVRKPINKDRDKDRDRDRPHKRANVWQGQKNEPDGSKQTFEDMMSNFKKVSDERMSSIKRPTESRRSNGRKG